MSVFRAPFRTALQDLRRGSTWSGDIATIDSLSHVFLGRILYQCFIQMTNFDSFNYLSFIFRIYSLSSCLDMCSFAIPETTLEDKKKGKIS